MRYLIGTFAAMLMLVGVASAETGFNDFGTPSYDQVIGSHTADYSMDYTMGSSCAMGYARSWAGYGNWSSPGYDYQGGYSYDSGPVEYGDDGWDWYTI